MPYGQDAKVGIGFQNSHGTAVTDIGSFYRMPFLSESIVPSIPELLTMNMEGNFDEGEDYGGPREVAGTINNEAQPVTVGVLLKAVLGNPTTTPNSVAAGLFYAHSFKPRTSDFDVNVINQPVTMHKNLADGGTVPTFKDLVGTRLELGVSNGEFLQATVNFAGGSVTTNQTSDTIAAATGKKWTWDVTSIQLGGAANTELSAMTIIVDEQATAKYTLRNSKYPARVKRDARRQIRVNGTIKFDDQTEYDKFLARSTQALQLTMTGAVEIRSGYYDVLDVKVPAFKYLTYPIAFADPSELEIGFDGKAEYHTGSGTAIEFTLTNTQATF